VAEQGEGADGDEAEASIEVAEAEAEAEEMLVGVFKMQADGFPKRTGRICRNMRKKRLGMKGVHMPLSGRLANCQALKNHHHQQQIIIGPPMVNSELIPLMQVIK